MRVLFYLPIVTDWWFAMVIEPLIRTLASEHEIHVLAPAPWRGTGIGPEQLARCTNLPDIRWYIMDGDDHPSVRTQPENAADLIGFVRDLAPDYTICRSADYATIREFPGVVRLVMEGRLEPFAPPPRSVSFQDRPLDQGLLPDLSPEDCAALDALIAPVWDRLHAINAPADGERAAVLARCGIPADKPVLLVPLECETEDNFFAMFRAGPPTNAELARELSAAAGDGFTLALTNHPINDLHLDNVALLSAVRDLDNLVLAPSLIGGRSSTIALAKHADGIILGDTKTFALGAFFGTPMVRRTHFESGAWLKYAPDLHGFLAGLAAGTARGPAAEDARRWFAFYFANELFDPQDPELTSQAILDRMARPVDRTRWQAGIERLYRVLQG